MEREQKMRELRRAVYEHFKHAGRIFPWRATTDPYHILVSEVMLQQTQAGERTIAKFSAFIEAFPTIAVLSRASVAEVYRLWQGLGYNRRAKALRDAAIAIVKNHGGKIPVTRTELEALPGVGSYTAGAVCVFAFNKPETLIETNIRTVFIHHFFPRTPKVHDKKLFPLIAQAIDKKNPRRWYSALMDYGAALKKEKGNVSRQSRHYLRQSTFKGSAREVRGNIMRALTAGPTSVESLRGIIKAPHVLLGKQLEALLREGMIVRKRGKFRLA